MRLRSLLLRLVPVLAVTLVAGSSATVAAGEQATNRRAKEQRAAQRAERLRVPDVRGQVYVFAKGMLEEEGFAWRVTGGVRGYAANVVVAQIPAPGTRVVDTGAPIVRLTLARNTSFEERGVPENAAPYDGTAVVRARGESTEEPPQVEPAPQPPTPQPPAPQPPAPQPPQPPQPEAPKRRAPDFVVPGAPPEPRDDPSLPTRARLLAERLANEPAPKPALVSHWRFLHAWIVTGARFGWSDGARALRILITVDRDLQQRWGMGARAEAVARLALAEVERRSAR
jgi:PASTA domain-containing protein